MERACWLLKTNDSTRWLFLPNPMSLLNQTIQRSLFEAVISTAVKPAWNGPAAHSADIPENESVQVLTYPQSDSDANAQVQACSQLCGHNSSHERHSWGSHRRGQVRPGDSWQWPAVTSTSAGRGAANPA